MKLQLDENTLNAYINEAIKQELNEAIKVDFDSLGEPVNPKWNRSWLTNNRNYFNLDKQKEALAAGTFGKGGLFGRAPKDAIQVLKDLGYSDEQIRSGITNGAIRSGKLTDTNGFIKYDRQKKQNRKTGNLMAAAGMDVLGNTPNVGAQDSTVGSGGGQDIVRASTGQDTGEIEVNWPWNSITQEEIDAAKRAQRAARQAAAARKAEQQQVATQATPQDATQTAQKQTDTQTQERPTTQPEAQPQQTRANITAVDFNPSNPINTPGATAPEQPTFATNAIRAMRQQAKSGNMALVNRTAQNAINALQKNGGHQNSNAIAQIKNALASLAKNGQ